MKTFSFTFPNLNSNEQKTCLNADNFNEKKYLLIAEIIISKFLFLFAIANI